MGVRCSRASSALLPGGTRRLRRTLATCPMAGGHGAVERGDTAAVGVAVWMAQLGGDAGFEALGDEVFQAFGLVVQLVRVVIEHAIEEGLDQAVVANDLERPAPALCREADTAMPLVFHQRVL